MTKSSLIEIPCLCWWGRGERELRGGEGRRRGEERRGEKERGEESERDRLQRYNMIKGTWHIDNPRIAIVVMEYVFILGLYIKRT